MKRYASKCPGKTMCEMYAKIYHGGPNGCKKDRTGYWRSVEFCFDPESSKNSEVVFNRADKTLTIGDKVFAAENNADSTSDGIWPDGTYKFERFTTHKNDTPNSPFGSFGNVIFTVPGRTDMGIHSGRADKGGPSYWTKGCIRTTDDGVEALKKFINEHPEVSLKVKS